jgi:simple sugar transport system permease protein
MQRKVSELTVLFFVLIAVLLLMWALNGSGFMSFGYFQSMAFQLPELGILSLAMMITMLTAGINLSIIASANLAGIIIAMILGRLLPSDSTGIGSSLIVLATIMVGVGVAALIGLLNGWLIAYLEISPILATLGTMIAISGMSIVLTKGYVLSGFPQTLLFFGNGVILGIPVPMLVFIVCALIMSLVLRRTPLGMRIYLLGSNPVACFYSGVNNRAVLLYTYLISGILAGLAAVIMIARFNSAKADYGESYLLLTILASVLGGVSASGGFGRVSGVVIALVILQLISSGLNMMGVNNFLTIALWGIILILVMVIKFVIDKRQERRAAA